MMNVLLLVLGAVLAAVQAVLVPGPIGPMKVAMRVHQLTDRSRWDPYAPANGRQRRRLLVSIFFPLEPGRAALEHTELVPYMPPKTAAFYGAVASKESPLHSDFFSSFSIEYSKLPGSDDKECGARPKYPVVLFSPGLGAPRAVYAAGARDLASLGYVVITIDHPHDASIVEFPDGTAIMGANITTIPQIEQALKVRAADVSFVIDQLHAPVALQKLTAGFPGQLDTSKIAMYGHSLGGATAAAAILKDKRILGGMNWDGFIFGNFSNAVLERSFALVGTPGTSAEKDSNWGQFYKVVKGSKIEVAINDTEHLSFMDVPLLVTTAELSPSDRAKLDPVIGKINGRLVHRIFVGTVSAFLDLVFGGKADKLRNLANDFEKVSIWRSNLGKSA
ncbi:hypothetical protein HIM_09699 [Hirsutella minnesotensis 3608]|uniref:1-alkyl-2-acetylglycerophosphocholine esterase n=1 Tax=Hirsutella minnesotensis 3608 TaxID=1043627 RepID=A0A0F7ZGH6_9HYPO|nr:hypothetical protein HIM_09699 [Hirsutella minnesotensis 3608]